MSNSNYDLVVKGGTVFDSGTGVMRQQDIGIQAGLIEALSPDISTELVGNVIDASDCIITPGLVDLHSHVYYRSTSGGIDPHPVAARSGVTTWIDAGSAGGFNLPGLYEYVARHAKVNVYAFINISCIGLTAHDHELSNLEYCSVDLLAAVVEAYEPFVVGVKYRSGRSGGAFDLQPLHRAKRASNEVGLPLMVHLSTQPPTLEEVLSHMGPGDILTHSFTGQDMKLLDENGRLLDVAARARDSGVLLDIGHGSGSFSWKTAEILAGMGFWPDTISTDIHQKSIHGSHRRGFLADGFIAENPGSLARLDEDSDASSMIYTYEPGSSFDFDLLDCMTKMLHLGMPLDDVLRSVTQNSASAVGLDGKVGSIEIGGSADLAILKLVNGHHHLYDSEGVPRVANKKFECVATIARGVELQQSGSIEGVPWVLPTVSTPARRAEPR